MNILVTGGTGFIGRHLCKALDERGHDVTALARDPDADLPESVERATGDITEYDSTEHAFEGQDGVVNLVSPSPLTVPKGGNETYDRVHYDGTRNCLRAAEEHGVNRFVQISGLGADPDGETHYIRAKGRADEAVMASNLDWTIIRPSVVFGDGCEFIPFTRMFTPPFLAPLPGGGKTRFQPIYIDDLVSMLGDALEDDSHTGEIYRIGGPEVLTLAEVGRLTRQAKGQPVTVIPVPMALAGVGLTVAGAIPGFPMGADQYRSLKFDNTVEENDITAFGVEQSDLTTLAAYLGVSSGS